MKRVKTTSLVTSPVIQTVFHLNVIIFVAQKSVPFGALRKQKSKMHVEKKDLCQNKKAHQSTIWDTTFNENFNKKQLKIHKICNKMVNDSSILLQ